MSETPTFSAHEIEQAVNPAPYNPESYINLYEDDVATSPEVFAVPDVNHETVAQVNRQEIERQPSTVEQMNAMTDAQSIDYLRVITPHVTRARDFHLAA